MKKLLFIFFGFLFIFINANSKTTTSNDFENVDYKKFYILENNKVKYLSKKQIRNIWENQLKEQGQFVKLKNFEILTSTDENNQLFYFLKSQSNDKTISIGAFFTKTEFGFLLADKTCSCAGCTDGCNLSTFGNNCRCSSCMGPGTNECKKTESITIKSSFD